LVGKANKNPRWAIKAQMNKLCSKGPWQCQETYRGKKERNEKFEKAINLKEPSLTTRAPLKIEGT
jgi:hypothetical protein